jgi:hypothetical protein
MGYNHYWMANDYIEVEYFAFTTDIEFIIQIDFSSEGID